jgi:hypothetical protein
LGINIGSFGGKHSTLNQSWVYWFASHIRYVSGALCDAKAATAPQQKIFGKMTSGIKISICHFVELVLEQDRTGRQHIYCFSPEHFLNKISSVDKTL